MDKLCPFYSQVLTRTTFFFLIKFHLSGMLMFISPNLLMIMPKIKYCLPLTYLSMDPPSRNKNKTKTKNAETQFAIKNNFTIILPRFF
jgi:hypothetical protein